MFSYRESRGRPLHYGAALCCLAQGVEVVSALLRKVLDLNMFLNNLRLSSPQKGVSCSKMFQSALFLRISKHSCILILSVKVTINAL